MVMWTRELKRVQKRAPLSNTLMLQGSHSSLSLSHTHANHVHAKRTAATRRTTANIQIQVHNNTNKINNSPGNWNWKVGKGGASRKLVESRWRCCCLGRRRQLAALCSTPVQISFKFWQIKPWFCYLRANERERASKRVRPMSIE